VEAPAFMPGEDVHPSILIRLCNIDGLETP
jgi:hypothetical protein